MKFNEIAYIHYEWLKKMNWNNTTQIESLGLLASEVGEAASECLDNSFSLEFSQELADIILRILGILRRYEVDVDQRVVDQDSKILYDLDSIQWNSRNNLESLSIIMIEISKSINSCRKEDQQHTFLFYLVNVLIMTVDLAERNKIDLKSEIEYKIERNIKNGNRGREK